MSLSPQKLDLPTIAFLAGSAANELILKRIRAVGHHQLRISHGYVFQRLLAEEPTVGELAASLGVTQQAASKVTRELEMLGYLERRTDPVDRRVTRLALTEHGCAAVEVARQVRFELERELADAVGPHDLSGAHRVLEVLLNMAGASAAIRTRSVKPQSS
jgi:DNA-binding MarR family transcriptional regulator